MLQDKSRDDTDHVDRWLMRHGLADALGRWRQADAAKAPFLAFTAIASEPRLFHRINGREAAALARQAEAIAHEIKRAKPNEPALAAAVVVTNRIAMWRAGPGTGGTPDWTKRADQAHWTDASSARETASAWKTALETFPQFLEAIARPLVDTTLELGAERLSKLGEPMEKVLALQTVRFAARSRRGHLRGPALPPERTQDCVRVVQEWSVISGKNAFIVPYAEIRSTIQDCALALFADAATSRRIAESLPGGTAAPGFEVWECAEAFHAYAVVSVNPRCLRDMPFERARACAVAARRLAAAHLDGAPVKLPEIPSFHEQLSPKMVLATARSVAADD